MNYQDFLSDIQCNIGGRISKDARLRIEAMPRNNGTSYDGLIILSPGRNVAPTIYLTPYYHRHLDGMPMEDICDDILETYQKNLPEEDFDTSVFTDFDRVKDRFVMRLVNKQKNADMLSNVPYFNFHDLAVIFYCLLHADDENQASIMINSSHLSIWGIDTDTLFDLARKNTPSLLPCQITPLWEIVSPQGGEAMPEDAPPAYVLSNRYRTNGASVILYEDVLPTLSAKLGSDLMLLPSSIHEIIAFPVEDDCGRFACSRMVREVNETQLSDEEILSDHAYYYNRESGIIS
ncbi:MAG: DUF5688 family protein [Clostridiales bacterium]|nr:DUF5688 family protein [Clostridiales bacterium]